MEKVLQYADCLTFLPRAAHAHAQQGVKRLLLDWIIYLYVCKRISEVLFSDLLPSVVVKTPSNLMASSTALQLGKFANPVSISFGKASTTPETQTLPAPNQIYG